MKGYVVYDISVHDDLTDKVITINDWWDGPMCGLATYNGSVYAYERIFDEEKDDYSDEYRLIPVSGEDECRIMSEWNEWCTAVSVGDTEGYHKSHTEKYLSQLLKKTSAEGIGKKAKFCGGVKEGFIPDGYFVEWTD